MPGYCDPGIPAAWPAWRPPAFRNRYRRPPEWAASKSYGFPVPASLEIELHARTIGHHFFRGRKHLAGEPIGQYKTAGAGATDHFGHNLFHQCLRCRIVHQPIGGGIEHHGQAIVTHIPNKLLPSRFTEIIRQIYLYAGLSKNIGDKPQLLGNAGRSAIPGKLPHSYASVIKVTNMGRTRLMAA